MTISLLPLADTGISVIKVVDHDSLFVTTSPNSGTTTNDSFVLFLTADNLPDISQMRIIFYPSENKVIIQNLSQIHTAVLIENARGLTMLYPRHATQCAMTSFSLTFIVTLPGRNDTVTINFSIYGGAVTIDYDIEKQLTTYLI